MKILHLYHDFMNLYGDYANVSALERILKTNGLECSVDRLSKNDEIDFSRYDFVYVGSGTEQNQKLALEHLMKYKQSLKEYIEEEKFLLMTGNSFEMLGESIDGFLGSFEGLGIFDFTVEETEKRITSDAIFTFQEDVLVGFVNKCSLISEINFPLFEVHMGLGDNPDTKSEGILYKNFYGTHLTGPILVKNPYFLKYIASSLCGKELDLNAFSYEKAAFEITKRKLGERNG